MKYFFALLLCAGAVNAQELLDEVVVTDSRIPKTRKNSGKAVVKITAKDIAKNQGLNLAQLLNQYAGIYISGAQMHPGQNLSYNIRGGNNRQVLVRIDGVLVSDPSQIESEFDLRLLSVDQIESIEVVKGAASSLYGSGAATAVIDITTKNSATEKTTLTLSQEWGTQNTHSQKLGSLSNAQQQFVQLQRSIAKIGFSASISRFNSDGMSSVVGIEDDAVEKENFQFNAKSQYTGPWAWAAFYQRDVVDSEYDATYPTYADAPNSFVSKQQRMGFVPSYTNGKSSVQAHVSWSDTKRNFSSNYPIDYTSNVFTAELTWRYRATERFTLLSGGFLQDIRSSSTDAFSPALFQHDNVAFFTGITWKHPKGFVLQLSGRNSVHSAFGAHQTYTLNPFYVFSFLEGSSLKLFGSLATSFIAPSQYKLFDPNYGNLNLAPEENRTYESGVEYVSKNSRITLVGFQRNENNVVEFVSMPNFTGQYRNSNNEFKVRGIEFESKFSIQKFDINANYTLTSKLKQDPLRLPKHAANLGLTFTTQDIQWGAHLRHVGNRKDVNFEDGSSVDLSAFTLVDVRVSLPNIIGNVTARLSLSNVLDAQYTEFYGFTTLGRNFSVRLDYRF